MRTETIMKTVKASLSSVLMVAMVFANTANAMPLSSSARTVIPADLQQLISVDYRALRDSTSATALKQHLTEAQPNLEQFEGALKAVGLNPDKDIDSLVLATFRSPKGVKMVGVAGGPFNMKAALKKMAAKKIKPTKYHNTNIYPMDGGFVMTFLDDSTLLFGPASPASTTNCSSDPEDHHALRGRQGHPAEAGDRRQRSLRRRPRAGVAARRTRSSRSVTRP